MVMGGGEIHQLATPESLIASPADDYVQDFAVKIIEIKMNSLKKYMDR